MWHKAGAQHSTIPLALPLTQPYCPWHGLALPLKTQRVYVLLGLDCNCTSRGGKPSSPQALTLQPTGKGSCVPALTALCVPQRREPGWDVLKALHRAVSFLPHQGHRAAASSQNSFRASNYPIALLVPKALLSPPRGSWKQFLSLRINTRSPHGTGLRGTPAPPPQVKTSPQ